ncbi:hypothetical protein ERX46_12150 [Brumimicrobium glaciale]|uniref:WG repeat-containing protein n=1 Tax=Brumimicrobium glaciale TaxID=200475 RepID=A0A4Q4KJE7_9FLAO|nr:DUF6770 family protein [Brumimicrobium glaciale]RYM32807.1 hypothetical protein ERX46_12150 [Brumimicrobium glaciale]
MKTKTFIKQGLFLFGMAVLSNISFAQDLTIDDVKIFEGAGDVDKIGFYSVYQADGEKGKFRNYTVNFVDYDYNTIGKDKIQLSKRADVIHSESNDSHLAISFGDLKEKKHVVYSFDKNGSIAGKLDLEKGKLYDSKIYKSPNGFVISNTIRHKLMSAESTIEIIMVDNEMNKLWTKTFEKGKAISVTDILSTENGVAVVYTSGKGMSIENYSQNMIRLDNSGEVVFDEVFANNFYYYPNKILLDDENTYIFGSYPEEGKVKPEGVFGIGFSPNGDIVMKEEVSFEMDIIPVAKDLMTEEQLNVKDAPQFIVNDVVKTDDGFYLITETIRLRPSLGGSINVGGGGAGGSITVNTAFLMGDFIILKFNKDLGLDKIKFVTKEENKIVVEGMVTNVNTYASMFKSKNISNYQFWVENSDGNPAMVYTIIEGYRNKVRVGIADITTEALITESEPIESEMGKIKKVESFNVLKNEAGRLSVLIYKNKMISYYNFDY